MSVNLGAAVDAVHEYISPQDHLRAELRDRFKKEKIIAGAIVAAAVALIILGFVFITTFGIVFVLASLPLLYLGYNKFKMAQAQEDTILDFIDFKILTWPPGKLVVKEQELKEHLYANTLWYKWAVDSYVHDLSNQY